jgi:hypothetical protein
MLSNSLSFIGDIGKGFESRIKQKGVIHIEIDFFQILNHVVRAKIHGPVLEPIDPVIPAIVDTENKTAPVDNLSDTNPIPDVVIISPSPTMESPPLSMDTAEILNRNPCGILSCFKLMFRVEN